MIYLLNWFVIILTIYPIYKSLKRIKQSTYSILHLVTIVFWVMQILPMIIEGIWGLDPDLATYYKLYSAMIDDDVAMVYDIFCFIIMWVLFYFANKSARYNDFVIRLVHVLNRIHINVLVRLFFYLGMFLIPLIAVMFAPDPKVYLSFSYFYMNPGSRLSTAYIYHSSIMMIVVYISFLSTMALYLFHSSNYRKGKFLIYLGIFVFVWLNGKRALFIFAMIGIIVVDILRQNFSKVKSVILGALSIIYFVFYMNMTGKDNSVGFLRHYFMYYSRMSTVKTSIYAMLNGEAILEYSGQSCLFDFLFFIPRRLWESKPVMFCKYFTSYTMNRNSTDFLPWNLQVNIWTEFIANWGIVMGILASVVVIILVAKITEKQSSLLVLVLGTAFITLYMMFGFETIVIVLYAGWIVSLVFTKILRQIALKR